uniref:C-type lectin domain-containing protein n=1 Tax=Caenorhabditis tropicalis TaxID=1561998 RepID=A0A1I7V179_9PELO
MRVSLLLAVILIGTVVQAQRREYDRRGGSRGNNNGRGRGCDSGWERFNRGSGGWCIKVFRGEHSQSNAEARCRNIGARLSGVQSQAEINYITLSALSLISQSSGSIWLGAKRTSSCSSSPLSSTCNSMNSFRWTDGSTQGTQGLLWNTNQPDNAHAQTQQCLVALASRSQTIQDQWRWEANRLDDVACGGTVGENGPRAIRAYACGKRA